MAVNLVVNLAGLSAPSHSSVGTSGCRCGDRIRMATLALCRAGMERCCGSVNVGPLRRARLI